MKNSKVLSQGRSSLRPHARIVQAIGQDLISNEVIALVELIKNAYDADAPSVTIEFRSPLRKGKGSIVVSDNGHGMTLSRLRNAWFEPATDVKSHLGTSPGGRVLTGEKGIGRFAAARVAESLNVRSTTLSPRRTVFADFHWKDFSKSGTYLDEIECDWREEKASKNATAGTTLTLTGLRDDWNRKSLDRLRRELSRLIIQPDPDDQFEILLDLPEAFEDLSGAVDPPEVLSHPHYSFSGEVSDEGLITGTIEVSSTGETQEVRHQVSFDDEHLPECGPFEFSFKVWDRDKDLLEELAKTLDTKIMDVRRDLTHASGIRIHRDSFRVLPYGSPDDDWLRLDLRRVQTPTMRLSNNQIVGFLSITSEANPELRDQTNREGLIQSDAFQDLRQCVLAALTQVERIRYRHRKKGGKKSPTKKLFQKMELGPIVEKFRERYPDDQKFLKFLEKRSKTVDRSIDQVHKVVVRYRRLATLGMLADILLHDGRTPLTAIGNQSHLIRGLLSKKGLPVGELREKIESKLDRIDVQANLLSSLFRRIAPLGGRKRGKPIKKPLEAHLKEAFSIFQGKLERLGVEVELPDTETIVSLDESEIQQVFINLIDNSLHWLLQVPKGERKIRVECNRYPTGLEILFADSGPGVPEDDAESIFDPYFSLKPSGVGLGLTIAGEIATDYEGTMELVKPDLLPGANFRIFLRKRVGNSEE